MASNRSSSRECVNSKTGMQNLTKSCADGLRTAGLAALNRWVLPKPLSGGLSETRDFGGAAASCRLEFGHFAGEKC